MVGIINRLKWTKYESKSWSYLGPKSHSVTTKEYCNKWINYRDWADVASPRMSEAVWMMI